MREIIESCRRVCFILFCLFFFTPPLKVEAQLAKDEILIDSVFSYYRMKERGEHGSSSFGDFESKPRFLSLSESIAFRPMERLQVLLGFGRKFSGNYNRPTKNNDNTSVTSMQKYRIKYFQDYIFQMDYQLENGSLFVDALEKRQKTDWNFATSLAGDPIYFNYFQGHYEDITIGRRFNDGLKSSGEGSFKELDILLGHLIPEGVYQSELSLRYRYGILKRDGYFYLSGGRVLTDLYWHRLMHQLTPQFSITYGLSSSMQFKGGVEWTAPYKYFYHYQRLDSAGPTDFIDARFRQNMNVRFPLSLDLQRSDRVRFSFGLPIHYVQQTMDSSQTTNDVKTTYDSRKLRYLNISPEVKMSYLVGDITLKERSRIQSLTQSFVQQNNLLFELTFYKDVTRLNKRIGNDALNILDPYNVFLYPVDFYMVGTEYSAFFSGNTATAPTNVNPQNHYGFNVNGRYGITDQFNVSFGVGYRSQAGVHHYDVKDKADRFFRFNSHVYIDTAINWQVTKDSSVSFETHYVPKYKTYMTSTVHTESFESETRYAQSLIRFQILY